MLACVVRGWPTAVVVCCCWCCQRWARRAGWVSSPASEVWVERCSAIVRGAACGRSSGAVGPACPRTDTCSCSSLRDEPLKRRTRRSPPTWSPYSPRPVPLLRSRIDVSALLLLLIRAYQRLAPPYVRGTCRHFPSCSEYAREAIVRHGAWRGTWLALRRLGRCHPLGSAGVDPVP